ncbi:MAG TPA: DinB family protein [Fimbriimonadaceae bacterium]|jgi:uncharacterized damage-inducible protein DinB
MVLDLSNFTEPLARTPRMLRAIIEGQPDSWLDSRHGPELLSPRQTVAHLILIDRESWVQRIRRALTGESTPALNIEEDELLATATVAELLTEFEKLRPQRIQELKDLQLTEEDFKKPGTHARFGPFIVEELLTTWVAHDIYHMGQIFKSYSAQYVGKIGPWQNFLNLPQFN